MLPIQCKMARTALSLGVRELADLAKVSPDTIARFERGEALRDRTVDDVRRALETAGVIFVEENGEGPGVRLKKGNRMSNVTFTEKESHPASFKSRREALGMTVKELAQAAKVSTDKLDKLEATPIGCGQYDSHAAFSVENALQTAEGNKKI